jgi:hypothetical protein
MAFSRIAYEESMHHQAGTQRRFHHSDSFNAYEPLVVSITGERGTESFEPAVVAACNRERLNV